MSSKLLLSGPDLVFAHFWFLQVQEISCAMSEVLEHPEEGSKHQLEVSEMRRRPEVEVQQLVGLSLPLHICWSSQIWAFLCAEMNLWLFIWMNRESVVIHESNNWIILRVCYCKWTKAVQFGAVHDLIVHLFNLPIFLVCDIIFINELIYWLMYFFGHGHLSDLFCGYLMCLCSEGVLCWNWILKCIYYSPLLSVFS